MNYPNKTVLDRNQTIRRSTFIAMVTTALRIGQFQFARQACLSWLSNFPGDLGVSLLYGKSLVKLGDIELAITVLDKILLVDPEYLDAVELLSLLIGTSSPVYDDIYTLLAILKREYTAIKNPVAWAKELDLAIEHFNNDQLDEAENHILNSIGYNPPYPLPNICHLQITQKKNNTLALNTLSKIYLNKWPETAQIKIIAAQMFLDAGNEVAGVDNLHWCAVHDTSGQVIQRMLGENHRFSPLWPKTMQIYLDLPIPAQVASEMGWNRIGGGSTFGDPVAKEIDDQVINKPAEYPEEEFDFSNSMPEEKQTPIINDQEIMDEINDSHEIDEDLEEIQKQFNKVARRAKNKKLANADSRFPVYVILASKKAMIQKYGMNTTEVISQLLVELAEKIQGNSNWNCRIFYPDDPECTSTYGIAPRLNNDPWKIKLSLSDLDRSLSQKGEMIGALLIVGGNDLIPFHQLPNPTDDFDQHVLSDNPYATLNENYYVPQWPVGRIPDEAGSDAGYLIEQIRFLNNEYKFKSKSLINSSNGFVAWLVGLFNTLFSTDTVHLSANGSSGLSAEVWQTPSAEVYSAIGSARKLLTCPPITISNLPDKKMGPKKCAYFNLHGLQDGPNWYGQKDPTKKSSETDYPVAFTPEQLGKSIPVAELVLSEACYGAWINEKFVINSIALKMLASGTRCLVGSTGIAYGSVVKPLIAADLLASEFWKQITGGVSVGYALMRAKINLAQQMIKKQGYLDGEDQKTILSFVLYGDPLALMHDLRSIAKPLIRAKEMPSIKVVSDSGDEVSFMETGLPEEILNDVKSIVSKYLPGLENGTYALSSQESNFNITKSLNGKKPISENKKADQRYVITLKKSIPQGQYEHLSFARMTLNKRGKIIKLAVSR